VIIASLLAKSLLATEIDDSVARQRLLDTTRGYTLERLIETGEHEPVARRQDADQAATTAEDNFWQALDWARRLGALSLELCVATSVARLLGDHGDSIEARCFLQPVLQPLYRRLRHRRSQGGKDASLRSDVAGMSVGVFRCVILQIPGSLQARLTPARRRVRCQSAATASSACLAVF
jgi:predicted ATPase